MESKQPGTQNKINLCVVRSVKQSVASQSPVIRSEMIISHNISYHTTCFLTTCFLTDIFLQLTQNRTKEKCILCTFQHFMQMFSVQFNFLLVHGLNISLQSFLSSMMTTMINSTTKRMKFHFILN